MPFLGNALENRIPFLLCFGLPVICHCRSRYSQTVFSVYQIANVGSVETRAQDEGKSHVNSVAYAQIFAVPPARSRKLRLGKSGVVGVDSVTCPADLLLPTSMILTSSQGVTKRTKGMKVTTST